MQFFYLYLL